jgi:hypothetical protein
MQMRSFLITVAVILTMAAGGAGLAWSAGWFDSTVHNASAETHETTPAQAGDLQEAIQLAKTAQTKLQGMAGYRCIYLRDERIDNELQQNYLKLSILHQPFSVLMEWVEPTSKKGRKVSWVAGKHDGKMRVKIGFVTVSMDPEQSIKRKESRHTIPEAGMKNMVDRLVKSWEEESQKAETKTQYSDSEVGVTVSGRNHTYVCRLVETVHPPEARGKYEFARTRVYFDKKTGLPVRMEGYDWPTTVHPEGILLERYTYLEVNGDAAPPASEFQL